MNIAVVLYMIKSKLKKYARAMLPFVFCFMFVEQANAASCQCDREVEGHNFQHAEFHDLPAGAKICCVYAQIGKQYCIDTTRDVDLTGWTIIEQGYAICGVGTIECGFEAPNCEKIPEQNQVIEVAPTKKG